MLATVARDAGHEHSMDKPMCASARCVCTRHLARVHVATHAPLLLLYLLLRMR